MKLNTSDSDEARRLARTMIAGGDSPLAADGIAPMSAVATVSSPSISGKGAL